MSEHEARATIQPPEDATAQLLEARSGQRGGSARDEGPAPAPALRHEPAEVAWSSHPVDVAVEAAQEAASVAPGGQSAGVSGQSAGAEAAGEAAGEAAAGDAPEPRGEARHAQEATRPADSAPAPRPGSGVRKMTWRPGMVVGGRYLLERNLGVGGTGLVVVAQDLLLRKRVAVKALRPSVARDPENVERFRREVAVCHAVTHPNIVRSFDIGEEDGVHYFSMEYLEGRPLSEHLREHPVLSPAEVRGLFIPVCRALQAAHEAKIVHRDLKPSNIMLVRDARRVVVMDFGISGLLDDAPPASAPVPEDPSLPPPGSTPSGPRPGDWDVTSAGWGTPKYMSPEQWAGEATGPASDLYSLGAILFQALTGRPPFLADDDRTFAALHMKKPAPRVREIRPDLPRDLDRIVARCLEKEPADRFPSASALADALEGRHRIPGWLRFAGRAVGLALVMALFAWGVIEVSNRAIVHEMRPAVQRLAQLTAQNVDVADLDAVRVAEDYTRPEFERVREYFLEVAEENPDAYYIYTLRAVNSEAAPADGEWEEGVWEFVVDKDPFPEDINRDGVIEPHEEGAMPGQRYEARHLDAMIAAHVEGRPAADADFVWDQYGLFLSGYAPLGEERGLGGYILGVDVSNERLLLFNRVVMALSALAWLLLLFAPRLLAVLRRRPRDIQVASP